MIDEVPINWRENYTDDEEDNDSVTITAVDSEHSIHDAEAEDTEPSVVVEHMEDFSSLPPLQPMGRGVLYSAELGDDEDFDNI